MSHLLIYTHTYSNPPTDSTSSLTHAPTPLRQLPFFYCEWKINYKLTRYDKKNIWLALSPTVCHILLKGNFLKDILACYRMFSSRFFNYFHSFILSFPFQSSIIFSLHPRLHLYIFTVKKILSWMLETHYLSSI